MFEYISVCSGIEAASVAWHGLGAKPVVFAEIESFPASVLAYRYPKVLNVGDMTALPSLIRAGLISPADVLVGGTPCQAWSVAGLRKGLDDPRGQLTLAWVDILNALDEKRAPGDGAVGVWENVCGVLNDRGNGFGEFLAKLVGEDGALQPSGGRWTDAGCVFGPQRAVAWRVLDAQYFGLAQRRRRVFVVASARDGFDPTAVLFEFDGVRRDTAPSRETGQETAGTLASRTGAGGSPGTDEACSGYVQPVVSTLDASYARLQGCSCQDMNHGHSTLVAFSSNGASSFAAGIGPLRTRAQDSHENLAVMSVHGTQDPDVSIERAHTLGRNNGGENAILAFSCKDYGADASVEIAPTMRAMGHDGSHANAGGQLAVCITGDITHTLKAEGFDASEDGTGRGQPITTAYAVRTAQTSSNGWGVNDSTAYTLDQAQGQAVATSMSVRRLTPRECERLQGFPDDWSLIPYGRAIRPEKLDADYARYLMRGGVMTFEQCLQAAADGPRYKALGNSMAVPCMRWLGKRLISELKL